MHYLFYPIVAGVVLALYLQLQSYQQNRKAQALGCGAAPWMKWGLFGWKNITSLFKADKVGRLPDYVLKRHYQIAQEFGRVVTTWRYSLVGAEHIHTSEPKNIQAILTTQFDDFEQGWIKRSILEPFSGPGIFSQDGKDWEHSRAMLRVRYCRNMTNISY